MLKVLLYLFDHHLVNDRVLNEELVEVEQKLSNADFPPQEIQQALRWLKELQYQHKEELMLTDFAPNSIRVWLPEEQHKLSADGLDFLLKLESQGIITAHLREVIIDRAMALNSPLVEIYQLKWVALIVLYQYQQDTISIPWLEHVLLNESLSTH